MSLCTKEEDIVSLGVSFRFLVCIVIADREVKSSTVGGGGGGGGSCQRSRRWWKQEVVKGIVRGRGGEIRWESSKVMPNISVMIGTLCWERRGQLGS